MKAPVRLKKVTDVPWNTFMLCKEGISSDVLGEKLRRNKEISTLLPTITNTADDWQALLPRFFLGDSRSINQVGFSKVPKLSGPEKPFVKLRPAYSVKLVFSCVVKGIKTKITAKFRGSRHFRFEDTKIIMSPEKRPKSFGTFEKRAPRVGPFSLRFY